MSIRLVQLAWRNLWRNPRRTFISVTAIALGYAMLLLFACLLHGLSRQMIDNGTRMGLSHMQVHAPDYYPDRSLHHTLGGRTGTELDGLLTSPDHPTPGPGRRPAGVRLWSGERLRPLGRSRPARY